MLHSGSTVGAKPLPPATVREPTDLKADTYRAAWLILGGARRFGPEPCSPQEVHNAILNGVPFASLLHLMGTFPALRSSYIGAVLGISARTLARQEHTPLRLMPAHLASATWRFAEVLALAVHIMGSAEAVQRWLIRPASGLDGQRPLDMLRTVPGAEVVVEFLMRLEYGVYT